MDLKEVALPNMKEKYLVIVDEATKLTKAIFMFSTEKGKTRNATTAEIITAYEEHWESVFGNPEILRRDPEGALCSDEIMRIMSEKGVHLSSTAGEAHWQLGVVERMIGTVFNTATRTHGECGIPLPKSSCYGGDVTEHRR